MIAKLLLLLLVGVVISIAIMGRERVLELLFGPVEVEKVDFPNLVLGPKPNQFLVCPKGYCVAQPHLTAPSFAQSASDLKKSWMSMIASQPRIEKGVADEAGLQYDFIQRTEWIRYPDSITVRFIPLSETSSTLAIYSRSHYGSSDFGVNEARIRAWLKDIE